MPIFEYRCRQCKKVSAILVRSASKKPACKHCASESLDRIISSFAVVHGRQQNLDDDYDNMQRKLEGVDPDGEIQSEAGVDYGTSD